MKYFFSFCPYNDALFYVASVLCGLKLSGHYRVKGQGLSNNRDNIFSKKKSEIAA